MTTLQALYHAIDAHNGTFLCEALDDANITRTIDFRHRLAPALGIEGVPDLAGLRDFYRQFGGVLFYGDEDSGEAAVRLAAPSEWALLRSGFDGWTEDMAEDEREEYLPEWADDALVVGEEPRTGNYLLIPTHGADAGKVFLFDHDGFEFTEQAPDLLGYAWKQLDPDDSALLAMATHLRFISDATPHQWWIRELRDNRGNLARTHG